ncbi:MAG: 50S ribosomal protein L21 [Nitrospira sp.]|nr:50S ribosomal protein L21 [Nitrospira sp.]
MYAILETSGRQYRVEPGSILQVETLHAEQGQTLALQPVRCIATDGNMLIGQPVLEDAHVKATVIRNGRTRSIRVFKKKRRKKYRKARGHRQHFTQLRVDEIVTGQPEEAAALDTPATDTTPESVTDQLEGSGALDESATDPTTESVTDQLEGSGALDESAADPTTESVTDQLEGSVALDESAADPTTESITGQSENTADLDEPAADETTENVTDQPGGEEETWTDKKD